MAPVLTQLHRDPTVFGSIVEGSYPVQLGSVASRHTCFLKNKRVGDIIKRFRTLADINLNAVLQITFYQVHNRKANK